MQASHGILAVIDSTIYDDIGIDCDIVGLVEGFTSILSELRTSELKGVGLG